MKTYLLFIALSLGVLTACGPASEDASQPLTPAAHASPPVEAPAGPVSPQFGDVWYQGKAEITSYALEQARYGEIHKGHAVLIYVTEDLSRSKQVKLDRPEQAGDDAVKVMKLNFTKKFTTGIYPYSMMSSVFTPVYRANDPRTLKITTSSQEWCGHTFTQLNLKEDGYEAHLYSYFESEGDQNISLGNVIPEDELWVAIRLNPDDLPTGSLNLIPGTLFQRLRHIPLKAYPATASLQPDGGNAGLMAYTVTYPDLDRTLTIRFNRAFPHEVESWEDTYSAGRGGRMTTKAIRMKRMMTDYWTRNKTKDLALRKELGLE